jgi:hypothetical protein
MQELTDDFIRTLAAANGLSIPNERLALVRRQYAGFLRALAEIETLQLPRETEPAYLPTMPSAATPGRSRR